MKEIKITNLIPNPDFTASQGGWAGNGGYATSHVLYGATALQLNGTEATAEVIANTINTIPLITSHLYYSRFYSYQETAQGTFDIYWPIAEPSFEAHIPVGTANNWNMHSIIGYRSMFTSGQYEFRLGYNNNNVINAAWFDGIMLIDLTADFGAGSEPDQMWCDTNIPFIKGTQPVPFWQSEVPVFEEACVVPNETIAGSTVQVMAKVKIANKLFTTEMLYSGEIYSGEV